MKLEKLWLAGESNNAQTRKERHGKWFSHVSKFSSLGVKCNPGSVVSEKKFERFRLYPMPRNARARCRMGSLHISERGCRLCAILQS